MVVFVKRWEKPQVRNMTSTSSQASLVCVCAKLSKPSPVRCSLFVWVWVREKGSPGFDSQYVVVDALIPFPCLLDNGLRLPIFTYTGSTTEGYQQANTYIHNSKGKIFSSLATGVLNLSDMVPRCCG